jgi:3-methyladenine DNA glycosylase AlkD
MPSKSADARSLILEIIDRIDALPGRSLADLRGLRREYSRRLRGTHSEFILLLASKLRDARVVHRFFSDELIANHEGAMGALTRRDLDIIGTGMNSWDQVDCFATIVAGPAWRAGRITDADVADWARSNDRWWRRAALVCTTRLNVRGTTGNTRRTLAVCKMLIEDQDDMIVKAMSWALRALAKRDPKAVATFTEQYRGRLAPRVVREVGNKLRTGLKTPRKTTMTKTRSRI